MIDYNLKKIFVELTSIDATSGYEKPVADYIQNFVKNLGLESYVDEASEFSKGNTGNVVVPIMGGGEYFIASHMDTPRSTKNLKHQFLNDRITSDGTTPLGVDDRGGLSSILCALERAVKNNTLKPCTLLFTVCEETTLAGSTYFKAPENIKYGFVFDSYMSPGCFVSQTCGLIEFHFKIRGKSAHAGISPEKGVNAIALAAKAMTTFPFGRLDSMNTANIGKINAGTATNVVCDEVTMVGELRSDTKEHGEQRIKEIIDNFTKICQDGGGSFEYEYFWDFTPYHIHKDDKPYRHFANIAESVGLKATPMPSMGGSDANAFNNKGIRTINIGVGAQNPHGNDEFILYKDFTNDVEIAYGLLTKHLDD